MRAYFTAFNLGRIKKMVNCPEGCNWLAGNRHYTSILLKEFAPILIGSKVTTAVRQIMIA
jgi:hypothetical protein